MIYLTIAIVGCWLLTTSYVFWVRGKVRLLEARVDNEGETRG